MSQSVASSYQIIGVHKVTEEIHGRVLEILMPALLELESI